LGDPNGAFYIFPNIQAFIGLKSPIGNTIESDVDLSMYILKSGKVVTLPGTKFSKPGYLRLAYAASDIKTIQEGLLQLNNALLLLK